MKLLFIGGPKDGAELQSPSAPDVASFPKIYYIDPWGPPNQDLPESRTHNYIRTAVHGDEAIYEYVDEAPKVNPRGYETVIVDYEK